MSIDDKPTLPDEFKPRFNSHFNACMYRENCHAMLALLHDCESYAGAMAIIHNSGEGAQLATRCREFIGMVEGKHDDY